LNLKKAKEQNMQGSSENDDPILDVIEWLANFALAH